ncbi:MAG: DUF4079 family protein [Desulfobulbus sp.]|nr:MAG: DUF4079 family protein [Desulfobulbus sp.]
MSFGDTDVSLLVSQMLPWLALGHGIYNGVVMLLFGYQGWLGHLIRRQRRAGASPPMTAVRRHRRNGPILVVLGAAGFLAGLLLVLLDKGEIIAFPLHFGLGLAIVFAQLGAYAVSRTIRARAEAGRGLHRLLGIAILCLYPIQALVGLALLL